MRARLRPKVRSGVALPQAAVSCGMLSHSSARCRATAPIRSAQLLPAQYGKVKAAVREGGSLKQSAAAPPRTADLDIGTWVGGVHPPLLSLARPFQAPAAPRGGSRLVGEVPIDCAVDQTLTSQLTTDDTAPEPEPVTQR